MFDLSKLKPNDWGPATVLIVLIVVAIAITGAVLLITTGRLPDGFQNYADQMTKLAGVTAVLGGARAVHSGMNANAQAKAVSGARGSTATFDLTDGDRPLDDTTANDVTPEMLAAAMAHEALATAQAQVAAGDEQGNASTGTGVNVPEVSNAAGGDAPPGPASPPVSPDDRPVG